jgi:DNA polymerase III epsilon subunit-like protein
VGSGRARWHDPGPGFVHPTRPITEGARAIHGISDAQVAEAPTFAEAWHELAGLLADKTVVAYNASFEQEAIHVSASPYFSFLWGHPRLRWFCAMEAFAAVYGAWHPSFKTYTWQSLATACAFFRLSHDQAHTASGDARVTAQLLHTMARLAEEDLPAGYHLPRDVACAGGCVFPQPFRYGDADDGQDWYCGACGVRAGVYHRCPQCKDTPTLVLTPDMTEWCKYCVVADKLERGEYHRCQGCGQFVEAPEQVRKYHDQTCQRRAARRRQEQREEAVPAGVVPVQAGQHQLEAIREGSARWRCTICQQTWTSRDVRSVCPAVLTFASWASVPADHFVTWTELRRRHYTTRRAAPHAAVRILKSPYFRYLYDIQRSTPVLLSEKRQAAIAKAKATSQAHFTCCMCQEYVTSQEARKAFVDQVCQHTANGRCASGTSTSPGRVRCWSSRQCCWRRLVLIQTMMAHAAEHLIYPLCHLDGPAGRRDEEMMSGDDPGKIAAVVSRLETLYAAAGPRLGCALVEANVLLVLADLRGTINFVLFEPTAADWATVAALGDTLDVLGLRISMMDETCNANGRMCSAVVVESLEGMQLVSSRSHMPGVVPFDSATGWTGREVWAKQVRANLSAAYPAEDEHLIYDRFIGMALGYPDPAIEDLCANLRAG